MHNELAAIRAQARGPFNVNFFCHTQPDEDAAREAAWRARLAPYYAEFGVDATTMPSAPARLPFSQAALEVVREFRPPVVSFHFGLPADDLLEQVRAWGAKILCSATTLEEALALQARGVDAVIAQGLEAGGHRGMFLSTDLNTQMGSLALLPQLVRALDLPVIAAGGIADARGVAAAMALGAAGVQVGTAYLLCPESTIGPLHRAALKGETAHRTALTNLFTGRPARGIVNRFMRECGPISAEVPAFPLAASAVAPLRAAAEARGSGAFSPLWAGQNTTGCAEVPAAEITRRLAAGIGH
jgi:nitronate monooxygenase